MILIYKMIVGAGKFIARNSLFLSSLVVDKIKYVLDY